MNTFKRKALAAAVLAGLGATGAEAVYRNPDQTGQVLIYPYYTVNTIRGNSYNTYFSITNTTADAKVLKVRFREGKTSAEVLDFNLYLSPNDMWVGAIVPSGTSDTAAAMIIAGGDLSCTDPAFPTGGEPFKNFVYASGTDALPGTGLERTREGYVEVFEMASLTGTAATNVTHTGLNLPPPNCAAMRSTDGVTAPAPLLVAGNTLPPTGGLYGQGTLINVGNGSDMGYVADALDLYAVAPYYFGVGTANPTLGGAQVSPTSSLLIANGIAYSEDFIAGVSLGSAGARAVASVFMHSSVLNDYILDTGTRSNTDWVLTFPIKREFVNATTAGDPFSAVVTTAGACEAASFTFFNRDEQSSIPPPGGFSPPGPGSGGAGSGNLCWESTVVSIRNGATHTSDSDVSSTDRRSGVLGSRNVVAVTVLSSFQNGWMNLTFTGAGATDAARGLTTVAGTTLDQAGGDPFPGPRTFVGLPVTGFMVRTFTNDAIDCTRGGTVVVGGCQGNYGSLFNHSYRTTVR